MKKFYPVDSLLIIGMEDRIRLIKNHYEPRLAKYGEGYEILDWESRDAQFKRFEVLTDNIDLTGKKLLDVGCGIGDLYGFLKKRRIPVQYYGVDILKEMTTRAESLHPEGKFFCGNLFDRRMFGKKQFDVVFASGLFSLNLGNNESFLTKALPVLFEYAKEYVVFNLLDESASIHGNTYYFFNGKEVLHRVRRYARSARCLSRYLPGDFTVIAEV